LLLVLVFLFSNGGLFAIEVGAPIDPAFHVQEAPNLPRPNMMGLSKMDRIGPVGDHGRAEIRKRDFDQAADDVKAVLIIGQPFDQPPLDDICETMPFEPVDRAVNRFDQLLLTVRPMELLYREPTSACTDPFDGVLDLSLGFGDDLRKPGSVTPLGFWFFRSGLAFHDDLQTVGAICYEQN